MKNGIEQRSPGSWTIAVYLGRGPDGKKQYKWETIRGTKKQAEVRRDELRHQLNAGNYVEPSKMTLSQFLDRWFEEYATISLRPKTYADYHAFATNQVEPRLGHIPLAKLGPLDLQSYYAWALKAGRSDDGHKGEALSPASVRKHHTMLHRALGHAVKWGLIARNPAEAVDPPKVERPEKHPLSAEDVKKFLTVCAKTDRYALYLAAITTGMRRGELLGLRWADVDFETGIASVKRTEKLNKTDSGQTKTAHSVRPVAISPETVAALKAHRAKQNAEKLKAGPHYEDHGLVFAVPGGRPIGGRNLVRQYKGLLKAAGLPLTTRFHDLRHTYATLSLKRNVHPLKVSVQLGHANPAFTMQQYQDVLPVMQKEAVAVLDKLLFKEPKAKEKSPKAQSL